VGLRFDPQTARLVPYVAGDHSGYVQSIQIYGADHHAEGRGPSGKAFRDGKPHVSEDFAADPDMRPWLAEATRRGFRSAAALPIRLAGKVSGVLAVNADEKDFFQDAEMALLGQAASDISFGLDSAAREEERRQAEVVAMAERAFSDTIIESMAGVLYLYDEHGQFLRWNRDFEKVTGYAAHEIVHMRPAEFFSERDRPLLTVKIEEVFEKGESSVEAPLRAKDGTSTPYFLTGRRIVFGGRTCLVGVGIDISERKRAEEALRELNEGLERKVTERTVDLQTALARPGRRIRPSRPFWRRCRMNCGPAQVHHRLFGYRAAGAGRRVEPRTEKAAWHGARQRPSSARPDQRCSGYFEDRGRGAGGQFQGVRYRGFDRTHGCIDHADGGEEGAGAVGRPQGSAPEFISDQRRASSRCC
jgi:PAS domain S-box-containing protein